MKIQVYTDIVIAFHFWNDRLLYNVEALNSVVRRWITVKPAYLIEATSSVHSSRALYKLVELWSDVPILATYSRDSRYRVVTSNNEPPNRSDADAGIHAGRLGSAEQSPH